jgi:dTDP-4-dehydrorhamnose reductase
MPQNLIIGANGLIGRQIARILTKNERSWQGTGFKSSANGLLPLEITNAAAVREILARSAPETVFHCAGLAGGADFCEFNPAIATTFHLHATQNLGSLCNERNARLVFISTDYVFDGAKGPYQEDDATHPLNLYGKLKLVAEEWIRANLQNYVIVRTTNVFGWDPETATPNYLMNFYRAVKENKVFKAPSFLWGNPTYVGDLAQAILELVDRKMNGVYHLVGSSLINRFEWAKAACQIFELDEALVSELATPPDNFVPRPLKSWLSTEKFRSACTTVLHDHVSGLQLMKKDMELIGG